MSNVFARLKQRLFPRKKTPSQPGAEQDNPYRDYHPAHEGDTPDDLHRGRHRYKETFTNHWGLDYLSREELDAVMDARDGDAPGKKSTPR